MRPPALNLKNCRIKKVFTNNINDADASYASGSEQRSLELEFGGLSPARLAMFNLEDPLPSPILERPLRIRSPIRNVFSEGSSVLPMVSIVDVSTYCFQSSIHLLTYLSPLCVSSSLSSWYSESFKTPDSSRIESQASSLYYGPPLVMNPDGSVQSPHRKPDLIIKGGIKKVCITELALIDLYFVLPPFEPLKRVLYTIPEEPEEEEMVESKDKGKALANDDEDFETVPNFIVKPRLKHRGFVVADGQDVGEALRLWVGNEEKPEIKTEVVDECHANDISSSSEYGKSSVESSMWRNTW
ncbi:uncharacterized protein MELLADRAFT_68175 [Melampsora larici-populina 98AG31]|uniref:Uncharacterized protein n=1 Tax=Melampsora larici-populina (strain 98AG31 / pathotype 3-4-7) TaxID=747676 RepID=F4S5U8_MELLP|nr:uncharacterized protein MELLADRAFT_68175 [Melampsora larici-populina 98AG31]EGF99961.1 hypothetical protein MELLADRAFT_68175 [Melampsora larici-populina 98AG31]